MRFPMLYRDIMVLVCSYLNYKLLRPPQHPRPSRQARLYLPHSVYQPEFASSALVTGYSASLSVYSLRLLLPTPRQS